VKLLKILNVLNPLLYYYKYYYKHSIKLDPYNEARRLTENLSVKKEHESKKVLIVPYRVSPGSNLFEGNCAIVLQSRGYHVDALMCGQAITHCEQIDFSISKKLRCNLCFYEQQKFVAAFGVGSVFINQYVSLEEKRAITEEIKRLDLNNLKDLTYKGVPVYRPLSSAMLLYLKSATFCTTKHSNELKGFIETIFITIQALDHYFSKNEVEFVLLSHGVYSTWGTVLEYCLAREIKCVTWGREYHGAGIIASHNASYLREPLYECTSNWINKTLTERQRALITEYLQAKVGMTKKSFDYVNYYSNDNYFSAETFYTEQNLDPEKPIVALLTSIAWDGQTFRPNIFFDDINAWVFETIDWFSKRDDCNLVIRVHPAEKHADGGNGEGFIDVLTKRYGNSLAQNIVVLPPASKIKSINLASISCAVLLYGSTIGYETTFLKIPTILASEFFYTNKEITFDPKTKEDYFALICNAIKGNLAVDEERHERLLQYAFHYQFRRIMPETLMNLKGLTFSGYKHQDLQSFVGDKTINRFIDNCLTGEKFYFDEFYE
jgi:hypothetical protein